MFDLDQHIARYPDFPKKGITFYDISPMLENHDALKSCVDVLADLARPYQPDLIVGLDARGFLFVTPVALALNAGAIMIRKKGKLPGAVSQQSYALEYGEATLALQNDRDIAGKTIVIDDDLLATGGTIAAANQLISDHGGIVAANLVLIELTGCNGRAHLTGDVHAVQQYDF